MQNFTYIFFLLFLLLFSNRIFCDEIYESDFVQINIKSTNAYQAKEDSINEVKVITYNKLIGKILDYENKQKIRNISKKYDIADIIIKNIAIKNEIITNEKYIAEIQVNFNKNKLINFFRKNKIDYSDLISEPYLIISTYNINFSTIGLNKKSSFNNFLNKRNKGKNDIIRYHFPNLDANDRYILPYKKIIAKEKKGIINLLDKYKLNKALFVNIKQLNNLDKVEIQIELFDSIKDRLTLVDKLLFDIAEYKDNVTLLNFLSDEILLYLSQWWKNQNKINNSLNNIINCTISSKNLNDLQNIRSLIKNLSQVKVLYTKKIQINKIIEEIHYFGDYEIFKRSLELSNLIIKNSDDCYIFST